MDRFLLCTKRLSYLLSSGVDFDFMDFESVERAEVKEGRLCVAGESYRAVIVPAMRTIRFKTMEKLASFAEAGGIVLLEGALPEASDRAGRGDSLLRSLVEHTTARCGNPKTPEETLAAVRSAVPGDSGADRIPFHLHRRIDGCDVFFLYGAERGTVCRLRATGEIHLFDPWTGEESPVPCLEQDAESTLLRLPLAATQAQVLVFSGTGKAQREQEALAWREETVQGDWEFELLPVLDNRYGDYKQPAYDGCVGVQARFFRFSQGERSKSIMRLEEVYFLKLGPFPHPNDEQLLAFLFRSIARCMLRRSTTVTMEKETVVFPKIGFMRPDAFWLDGKPAYSKKSCSHGEPIPCCCDMDTRGEDALCSIAAARPRRRSFRLPWSWYENETILPLTPYPKNRHVFCRFAFDVPPALSGKGKGLPHVTVSR